MRYGVYTFPAGQTPARLLASFKTKREAIAWSKRERYMQVLPLRKGIGR